MKTPPQTITVLGGVFCVGESARKSSGKWRIGKKTIGFQLMHVHGTCNVKIFVKHYRQIISGIIKMYM